jgi:hypothetical protein
MIRVYCLDTNEGLWFDARTPYEAMEKLLYTLNLTRFDPDACILELGGGRTLTVVHSGRTWSCPNR